MADERSKRQIKSDAAAQLLCRELRYQISVPNRWDAETLCKYLMDWMDTTGKIKYERPEKHRRKT